MTDITRDLRASTDPAWLARRLGAGPIDEHTRLEAFRRDVFARAFHERPKPRTSWWLRFAGMLVLAFALSGFALWAVGR
jgi:hypothetical protein